MNSDRGLRNSDFGRDRTYGTYTTYAGASVEGATFPHSVIAVTAHGLWERAGRPSGRDWYFWFAAERELASALALYVRLRRRYDQLEAGHSIRLDAARVREQTIIAEALS